MCMQCFCQRYHPWSFRVLYPLSWYSTHHPLGLRTSLDSKRSTVMVPCWCNLLVSPRFLLSEKSCLDRMAERTAEDSVTVPARWKYVAVVCQVSPKGCVFSEWASNIWCFFYLPRFTGPTIKMWKCKGHHSISPLVHTSNIFASSSYVFMLF